MAYAEAKKAFTAAGTDAVKAKVAKEKMDSLILFRSDMADQTAC